MKPYQTFRRNFLFLFFIFILLFKAGIGLQSKSPVYHVEHLTIDDGLSQSSVNCILQDSMGFLWFGTQDGLNRYDGYEFRIFKNRPFDNNSLSNNWIQTMIESEPGVLWLGTWSTGLNRFDTLNNRVTRWKHTPGDNTGLSSDRIRALYRDSGGVLWIGTWGGGLNRLDPGTDTAAFTHYKNIPGDPSSLSHNEVSTIYEDISANLWIGTSKGLNLFDRQTGQFTRFFHDASDAGSLSGDAVTVITGDDKGNLWVGILNSGLNRYLRGENRFERFIHHPRDPNSLCSNTVSNLLVDSEGHLWVGTGYADAPGSGVSRLTFNESTGKWEITYSGYKRDTGTSVYMFSGDLKARTVLCSAEDNGGNIWFGTFQPGLIKLSKRRVKFSHYFHDADNPNSLSDNLVMAIYEDAAGILWLGTHSGGLNRFDRKNNRLTHYTHDPDDPTGIRSNSIIKIYCDRSGSFWLGTNNGLMSFNPGTELFTHFDDLDNRFNLSSNSVEDILEDSDGNLWIGMWGGPLIHLDRDTGKFTAYPFASDSPNQQVDIMDVYEDKNKELWLCTFGKGLVKVIKSRGNKENPLNLEFRFYSHNEEDNTSISSDYVGAMLETDSGQVWIASNFGVNRFNKETGTFTCFSEVNGLCNNLVYGIVADGDDLWLSTNGGLSQFNTKTLTFRNFDTSDGVQSMEFNAGAYFKSRRGEIFFGGVNGFNAFYPQQVGRNSHVPPIVITGFSTFASPMTFARPLHTLEEIRLTYKDRYFSFQFAALDFENPGKNLYAYKLEGFDHDWIKCGSRRFANYTNLSGGEFVFRVKGSNNDGEWNETGAAIRIHIKPPFWKTRWFMGLAVMLVIGVFLLLLHLRIRHLKQKMEKEHLENELKLKTDFTAMLVHDLRNPLQCIIGYTELLEDETAPAGTRQFTDRIKMSSSQMLQLVNDMLDISKFEAGKMVVHPKPTNLVDIIKDNIRLMTPLLVRKHNRFELRLDPLPPIELDPVRISQVINNLLANAVKFSPKGGVITISAKMTYENERQYQEVSVADEGPGIDAGRQAFIFFKYAQINHKSEIPANAKGTGLGLAVSRLIIESHQGTIGYQSADPTGSIFYFRIPLL
jgi:signal transduction histidine kinase/ligand-binding sensor domain-containing protein